MLFNDTKIWKRSICVPLHSWVAFFLLKRNVERKDFEGSHHTKNEMFENMEMFTLIEHYMIYTCTETSLVTYGYMPQFTCNLKIK